MISRDRCSTSYDLASLFSGRRNTLETRMEKSQNALVRCCQLSTQLSMFEGSLAALLNFWMWTTSIFGESLAELLCF